MMPSFSIRLAFLLALVLPAACGTVEGIGEDLQTAGGTISREAQKAQ
ncbi:MAG: entericidin A/B family lipoprotein [Rhodobacteraceae bacterium]|nr:entericidin A/B family lipoprotein [Paracoccaceae bacterium]